MSHNTLSPHQQSILYALLYSMIQSGELNLSKATETENEGRQLHLQQCLNLANTALDAFDKIGIRLGPLTPIASATRHLIDNGIISSIIYLASRFEVERSSVYYPGITEPDLEDSDGPEATAGDLKQEFPDEPSRITVLAELWHWAQLDPTFEYRDVSLIAKVKHTLEEKEGVLYL
jgi:hypothetical protein